MKSFIIAIVVLFANVAAFAQSSGCYIASDGVTFKATAGYELVQTSQNTLLCKQIGGGSGGGQILACVCEFSAAKNNCEAKINPDNNTEAKCIGGCTMGMHGSCDCMGMHISSGG